MDMIDRAKLAELVLQNIPEVELIYLFGSQADSTARADSDVDLAFKSRVKIDPVDCYRSAQEIAATVNRDVDLVDLDQAGALLAKEIVMRGELLLGDKIVADTYAVRAMREYQDHKMRVADIEREILARRGIE